MKSINRSYHRLLAGLAVAFPPTTALTAFAFGGLWWLTAYAPVVAVLGLAWTTGVRLTIDRREVVSVAPVLVEAGRD